MQGSPPPPLGELVLEAQPRRDVHAEQLLDEQLGGVGDGHLDDVARRLAALAPVEVAHEAARLAHVDLVLVRRQHEPLQQQLAGAVRDEAVALHLAEAETAVARAALGGLPRQDGAGPPCPGVHLVLDHVLQLLVVDGSREDVERQRLARDARREVVLAAVAEPLLDQDAGHLLDGAAAKGGAVAVLARQHARLAGHELEHLTDRHARGESVRVHDDVRDDALVRERHVDLLRDEAHDALLAVAGREFVADLGATRLPRQHLDELILPLGHGDHDLVDVGWVWEFVGHRGWQVVDGPARVGPRESRRESLLGGDFVDVHLARVDLLTDCGQTVALEEGMLPDRSVVLILRSCELVLGSVGIALEVGSVFPEDLASSETAIDRSFVQDEGIFDIVA